MFDREDLKPNGCRDGSPYPSTDQLTAVLGDLSLTRLANLKANHRIWRAFEPFG